VKTPLLWLLAGLSLGGLGCSEALEPVHTAADTRPSDRRLPVPSEDDFWMATQWSEQRRPAPERPRSISLGYIGDGVLPGGITRDDPVPPSRRSRGGGGQTWQEYVNSPGWGPDGSSQRRGPQGTQAAQGCRCSY
jgi:hypothetical protein